MKTIRIGGVPEHFNLPIHLAIESGQFRDKGIDVEWVTYQGGTGQMTRALRDNQVDCCILLTEGIVKDIIEGNPSKLISNYVNTPLTWGIHTGINNTLQNHRDIYKKKYAISRFGSGSHLMAIVDANQSSKSIDENQFVIVDNLKGALDSLQGLSADVFYWEKYTTKPYVDQGIIRRIGEFVTPWPCFVIAATNNILENEPQAVIRMLRVIHDISDSFMQDENNIELVAQRYSQKIDDVKNWYYSTEWAIHGWINNKMIQNVIYHLNSAFIINRKASSHKLVWDRS